MPSAPTTRANAPRRGRRRRGSRSTASAGTTGVDVSLGMARQSGSKWRYFGHARRVLRSAGVDPKETHLSSKSAWRHEPAELALDKPGKGKSSAVLEVGSYNLHTNGQSRVSTF